jgi:hypothetical protein
MASCAVATIYYASSRVFRQSRSDVIGSCIIDTEAGQESVIGRVGGVTYEALCAWNGSRSASSCLFRKTRCRHRIDDDAVIFKTDTVELRVPRQSKHGSANREAVHGIFQLALRNDFPAAFHGVNEYTFPKLCFAP